MTDAFKVYQVAINFTYIKQVNSWLKCLIASSSNNKILILLSLLLVNLNQILKLTYFIYKISLYAIKS